MMRLDQSEVRRLDLQNLGLQHGWQEVSAWALCFPRYIRRQLGLEPALTRDGSIENDGLTSVPQCQS